MGKIGPKEQALKALKSQRAELDIPPFLRRTETPEQAAKREAKHAKKTDTKLKVIEPYNPNDPIRKAIAKEFRDDTTVLKSLANEPVVDAITKPKTVPPVKTKPAKEKKLPHALKKALAEKEKLETLVHSAQAQPMETDVKKKTAKSKTAKTKAKAAPKKSARKNGSYDWDAATATAKSGKVPPLPSFRSYAPHLAKFRDLAMKKDVAGIKKFAAEFCDEKGARANLFHYRDLCLMALKA